MNILFNTYPYAFHQKGGGEIQLLKYKEYLSKINVNVKLFDLWSPNFYEYDLVHFFSCFGGSIPFCEFVKSLNIPLVVSSSLWISNDNKDQYDINSIAYQLNVADLIITNSEIESKQLSSVLQINKEKFCNIYNATDSNFNEVIDDNFLIKYKINSDYILNVANIEKRKNQLSLAKALLDFPDYKLIIIGNIRDKSYYDEVKKVLKDRLMVIDFLSHDSQLLKSAFKNCALFALPSLLETPGIAAIEAALFNKPILITKIGSTKEYFGNHVFYVDPYSIHSISKAIKKAKSQKNSNLSNIIRNNFIWDKSALKLKEVYKNIIQKKH